MTLPIKIEIAQSAKLKPITEIAVGLGLSPNDIEMYARARRDVSTMPGESTHSASEEMDIDENGIIKGLA